MPRPIDEFVAAWAALSGRGKEVGWRGIPAVICGPSPLSMGTDNEHVTIEEAINVLKLQVMCAVDYLSVPASG